MPVPTLMPLMPAASPLIPLRRACRRWAMLQRATARFPSPQSLRRSGLTALGLALALAPGVAAAAPPQQLPIEAQWCLRPGTCLQLEVADQPAEQAMGLQLRGPLPPLRGMWFPFAQPSVLRFWMHRTPQPLDMLFVRDARVIAIVAGAAPCPRLPCRSYGPDQPADGVLELAAGQAAALGIAVGMPVRIESLPHAAPLPVRP